MNIFVQNSSVNFYDEYDQFVWTEMPLKESVGVRGSVYYCLTVDSLRLFAKYEELSIRGGDGDLGLGSLNSRE
jgi:hypothetical protein